MVKNCAECNLTINVRKSKLKEFNFCSKQCYWASKRGKTPVNYVDRKVTKNCLECDSVIIVIPSKLETNKFCSHTCYSKYKIGKSKPCAWPTKKCINCKSEFYVKPSKYEQAKFCTTVCTKESREAKTEKFCVGCGVLISVIKSLVNKKKFCSLNCFTDWRTKKASDDIATTKQNAKVEKKDRQRFRRLIRPLVLKRDGHACTVCNNTEHLQVDHILRWSRFPKERFDITNCRTLCKSCHYEVTYGRKLEDKNLAWGNTQKFKERI